MNSVLPPGRLAFLGMMTALVFASNYARIIMPIAIGGRTSFTLANIVCCLSGLLLGPIGGLGLRAWAPPSMDLTNPLYAAECWITFLTKGIMGLAARLGPAAAPPIGRLPAIPVVWPARYAAASPITCSTFSSASHTTVCWWRGFRLPLPWASCR